MKGRFKSLCKAQMSNRSKKKRDIELLNKEV